MPRLRFRWTRERYRKADSLARYFARHVYDLPSEPPELVRRLFELQERHPQHADPLLTPLRGRLNARAVFDEVPF